jgi:hypothetical protein
MKLLRLFALLFAALALLACGSVTGSYTATPPSVEPSNTQVIPAYVDVGFSSAEKVAILASVAEWNWVLNGYARLDVRTLEFDMDIGTLREIVLTGQGLIFVQRFDADDITQEVGESVLGWSPGAPSNEVSIVSDRIGTRNLKTIVMHEIGHALGAQHLYIRNTLMFPQYQGNAPCIDKITVQYLATVRDWDWTKMNYCAFSPLDAERPQNPNGRGQVTADTGVNVAGWNLDSTGPLVVGTNNGGHLGGSLLGLPEGVR